MSQPVQAWEVTPAGKYVVASQFGPTYTGPLGLLQFVDGVARYVLGQPRDFIHGRELKGATGLSVLFEHSEGHELRWVVDCWVYEPAVPAPVPVKPAPVAKPKRRPGRPKGSKNKRKAGK